MSAANPAAPVIVWFRDDLRLADNPALHAAAAIGAPVIPVFVLDETRVTRRPGAAALWWLERSLGALSAALAERGSRLTLRRGDPAGIIKQLAAALGARAVVWNRAYEPKIALRDSILALDLARSGVEVRQFDAALLTAPGDVRNAAGDIYKVFTAFWRAARRGLDDAGLAPSPSRLAAPDAWPSSDATASGLRIRGADGPSVRRLWSPGEAGAAKALDDFIAGRLRAYRDDRERPAARGSSRLSPHLRWGEISPRRVWRSALIATTSGLCSEAAAERFLTELGWRDFNWHLLSAHPDLASRNMRPRMDDMRWRRDRKAFEAWRRGRTGYPMVDAGMRELAATGFMQGRVRMIAASFLVKHLMIDWRWGERWFWDKLLDADAANNPANWQWVAGSGADAAPFFRIFNPTLQGRKFDPDGAYARFWLPELANLPTSLAHEPWRADPRAAPDYPKPIVLHPLARARALAAYADLKESA